MMLRGYHDLAGNYLLPPQAVTLATLGVPPYSPPSESWESEDPASSGSAEDFGPADISRFGAMPPAAFRMEAPSGISLADMARTISPAAEAEAWREDNGAPFWIPDGSRASSGPSFDDYVRTIDPRANADGGRSNYAGWGGPEDYSVPYDPRAAALGAFRIPGLPEDATGWGLRERLPAGADEFSPVQLVQLGLLKALSRLGFSLKNRLLLRKEPDGPIFRGGDWRDKDLTPRYDKNEKRLSARTSLSNPYPTPPGGQPVFREGKYYLEIDSSKLPWGSVYVDNKPPGHVTIWPVDPEVLRRAVIERKKLR